MVLLAFAAGAAAAGASVTSGSQARSATGVDLRDGAVFTMSNSRAGNRVVAFAQSGSGRLHRVASFSTWGRAAGASRTRATACPRHRRGRGGTEQPLERGELLFAANVRSNTITAFRVERHGLRRVEVQASEGEKPVSVTVNRGVLYVLNTW